MRKAMFYPFSARCLPLTFSMSKFQPEYRMSALVSPVGLGLFGRTPFYAANRTGESDLLVQCEIEVALKQCDALIVPYGDYKNDPSFYNAIDVIHCAVAMGKEIFCCLPLRKPQRKEIENACQIYGATWHNGFQESFNIFNRISYGNYKAHVPVVFVHDLGIEADSFEITLSLTNKFIRDGYKVSTVGPNPEYNILGFHGSSLLLSMLYGYEKLRNVPQFIKKLKFYMHMIEVNENPDVILFHCPGAAVPMDQLFQNDSGVYTYLVSRAIRPDFSLVCMAYSTPSDESIRSIHTELDYQFGFGIDALHLSNCTLHVETTKFTGAEQHVFIPEESALETAYNMRLKGQNNIPIFCALNESDQEQLYAYITNILGAL